MTSAPSYSTAHAPFTILLVDDEEDIRELLGMLLDDLGFAVLTAANGDSALTIFQEHRPDIILSDIKMPGMNGIELLKEIKRESPETEVIMISGHGDMQLAIEALKFQAADFITKPIDDDILAIALNKVTEKLTLRRQVADYTLNLERLVQEKSNRIIELERETAAEQIVSGLSGAMSQLTDDIDESGLFTALPFFISLHSADLQIITTNDLYKKKFGDQIGQPSLLPYKSYSGPGSCPACDAMTAKASTRGSAVLKGIDGVDVPVITYTAPITGREGAISLILEVAVDVTEVKALHAQLTATQRKYEHLFNSVPCYITVQDRDMRIVEANARFRDDFGFEHGLNCHQAYKRRDTICEECPVQKTFMDGQHHQRETVVTAKSGEQVNILVWTAPLRDADSNIEHVLEVSTNITMVRELQNQLTSLGMMLGSMSHGVKGLLTALDGGAYRIESGLKKGDTERITSGWKVVKHRLGHMKKMVMDTLYYAKSRELELNKTTLGELTDDLIKIIEPNAENNNIALISDFRDTETIIEVDTAALSSALINLLENCVDACVFDRTKEEHTIHFSASVCDENVCFEITDNGTGMDRETREKMFTLFFSSKGANGTGIGLFISNQVIAHHSGTIEVESTVGCGTQFYVQIPIFQTNRKSTSIPKATGTKSITPSG